MRIVHRKRWPLGCIAARTILVAGIASVDASGAAAAAPPFSAATPLPLIMSGANSRGAAWRDFDLDGLTDLYVTVWDGPNKLFRNEGGGAFSDVTRTLGWTGSAIDLDGNVGVDGADLAAMLSVWGEPGIGDLDSDGTTDGTDLAILLANWSPIDFVVLEGAPPSYSGRAIWGDIDNDGDPDLYWTNSGANVLLRNEGGAAFTDISTADVNHTGLCRGAAWMDLNGDSLLDVYVSTHIRGRLDGSNQMFMNLDGTLFDSQTTADAANNGVGRGVAWADYDNDGDMDLYVANGSPGGIKEDPYLDRKNILLRNDGGLLVDATIGPLGDARNSRGVAWGDYDNDGDMDLYVANIPFEEAAGNNMLLRNDGGVFTDVTVGILGDASPTRDCAWIDVDNDGDLDLYIANANVPNRLLLNDNGTFVADTPAVLANSFEANGASWADFDGDGDLDVYITNKNSGNVLARNDLNSVNHWLQVRLVGTVSNRDGFGARLTATTGATTQIREIAPCSGYFAQHMINAHFGLGAATTVDSLTIRWPSGIVQVLNNVPADQLITVTEPPE